MKPGVGGSRWRLEVVMVAVVPSLFPVSYTSTSTQQTSSSFL